MAFKPEYFIGGENFEVPQIYPTTANATYTVGEILALSSGKLVAAGVDSDGVQEFVCLENYTAPATGMRGIKVAPILKGQVYRTTFSATPTSLNIGDKVTLTASTLDGVTATKTKGVAEIVDLLGAAASGDEVLVKF